MNFAVQRVSLRQRWHTVSTDQTHSFTMTRTSEQPPPFLLLSRLLALGKCSLSSKNDEAQFDYSRYGLVGLLRPLTVYPSEMVYWGVRQIGFLLPHTI